MYLLGSRVGWPGQRALWQMIEQRALEVFDLGVNGVARSRALMEKYQELPMDLADATLVALAESRGTKRVFTLDTHFSLYRFRGRELFETIPN